VKVLWLVGLAAFALILLLTWLGQHLQAEVCVAGQILTDTTHIVYPVECG